MFRSLSFAMLMSAAVLAAMTQAHADGFYNHNGSLVELEWLEGDGMVVTYVRPRNGLPSSVRRGTVLFEGASPANGSIYGTAYVFSNNCGAVGYRVEGRFSGDDFWIDGPAPVRNANCRVVRYEMNHNSRLDFHAR